MNPQQKKIAEAINRFQSKKRQITDRILIQEELKEYLAKEISDIFEEEDRKELFQEPMMSKKHAEEMVQKNKTQFLKIAGGEE